MLKSNYKDYRENIHFEKDLFFFVLILQIFFCKIIDI